jgi:hypothetical protein
LNDFFSLSTSAKGNDSRQSNNGKAIGLERSILTFAVIAVSFAGKDSYFSEHINGGKKTAPNN